jgi:hypothetical protein
MTAAIPTYPDHLRNYVAQLLRHHFETGPSKVGLGSSGISVTGAVLERAAMLSMRTHRCPVCKGNKVQSIPRTNGTSIEVDCWRCIGQGEIGELKQPKLQDQTTRCGPCRGSGTIPRPEYKEAKAYDPNPDECLKCDGRGYRWSGTVYCGTGEYPHAQPTPGEVRSEVTDAFDLMRERGQERSLMVLNIAYGEVGRFVERQLGLPAVVSIWPHTPHGKKLLKTLGSNGRSPSWRELHECLGPGEWSRNALANMANTAAIALLELALSHLATADTDTGARIAAVAKRLEGETSKWRK